MSWDEMRNDWGKGSVYVNGSHWVLLLLTEAEDPRIIRAMADKPEPEYTCHLIGTRIVLDDEETLFLPSGRRFVYVTGFLGEEYGTFFTEALANYASDKNMPVDWDGDWRFENVDKMLDDISEAMNA